MRYLLLIQYDGADFSGYQRQGEKRTVQSVLERAAGELFGVETRVTASGRTDAGVHAYGQVCQLDAVTNIPAKKLAACFNAKLPPDVKVLKSAEAPEGFDCTRGAKQKTYVYTAYYAESELPLLERCAVRLKARPDLERMRAAAKILEGEHDFAAFRAAGYTSKTSVRTLYSVKVETEQCPHHELFRIFVTGNGFLYNMVRILAGELVSIGSGKGIENILKAFQTGERSLLARTMPARGLILASVDYGVPLF